MRRLKNLHIALLKSGFKREAAAILKMSRDNDIYYSTVINKVLNALQSGNYLQLSNDTGVFLTFHLTIDVPELSYISDYNLNEISIFIIIKDPKISTGLSEKEKNKRKKMIGGFRGNSSDIPYASQFSFKMDDGKVISSVNIFPNYKLFKRISTMSPGEVITELLNSNPWDREYSLMTAIYHEVTHVIDNIRSDGKSHKSSYLQSLLKDEEAKLLEAGNLSEEEKNLTIRNRDQLEKKLEKANELYDNKYSDNLSEVNARINEVIAAISRGIGVNYATGEGWVEIAKRWAGPTSTLNYSHPEFRAEQVFEMINDGDERGFIEYILSRFKGVLLLNSASPEVKKKYIDRIQGVYNRLREIHRMFSPPAQEEQNLSNAIVSQHKIDLSPKNILSGLF
jgi:hypothetical protein